MGFNSKNWNNTTLTTSDLNRIEKGIKDSHDTLDLLGEEVSALQLRQISNQSDIKILLKDTPTLAATLNEIENLLNKDNKVLETLRDINQLVTKQELDERLFGWIKITDIKQDGNSIYDGDSIINIKSKPIDTSLDINSNNAISNKAVTKALNNLNLTGNIPTKLAELSQDSLHQTVTASEKSKWNSILETLDNIILTETDPTVPDWAKQKTKPYYDYAEIINTPAIPTKYSDLQADITYLKAAPVTTVNNKQGDIIIYGTDIKLAENNTSNITNAITNANTRIENLTTTVNGKADISAIPTKTSQLTNDSNFATTSQIPDTSGFVPNTRTINSKALSSNISLSNKDVGALPDYTISISHQSAGNPRMVKFVSVNYASKATCFKMGAMTCHDNGVSYQFLTDMLIAVTTGGVVTANIYKFAQSSIGSVDGVARYTGDVFYVNDTTNKIVDFYILCGQWSVSQFTPVTKVGSTTIAYVTQYSGNANYYSSGDKVWVNGCGTTYARLSDLSNYLPLSGGKMTGRISFADGNAIPETDDLQFIAGIESYADGGGIIYTNRDKLKQKLLQTNGAIIKGRVYGSGDDEGLIIEKADNGYAGLCLGSATGARSVFYLKSDNNATWRWSNGSSNYDISHPQKEGTVALTSDIIPKWYNYTIDASSLNVNTWYPVTIQLDTTKSYIIEVCVALNSGTKPSWATHGAGFSVRKRWVTQGCGWGTQIVNRYIFDSKYSFCDSDPVRGLTQMTRSSTEVVYVRGGGKYHFFLDAPLQVTLRTSTYTVSDESVSPVTTAPAEIIQDVMTTNTEQTITANKIFNGTVRINGTIIV